MILAAPKAFVLYTIVLIHFSISATNGNSSFYPKDDDYHPKYPKFIDSDDDQVRKTLLITNDIFHSNNHLEQLQQTYPVDNERFLERSYGSRLLSTTNQRQIQPTLTTTKQAINAQQSNTGINSQINTLATRSSNNRGVRNLNPIILIPGDGGSRLQAKLDRQKTAHVYCERKSNDWFDLWLNLSLLVPFALDCWVENMKMVYNATTRETTNPPGVITRVQGFGTSDSVEFVDAAKVSGTSYFETIVKNLLELGYERDKNILGAPYDFRRAPNELQDYFRDLKDLIEIAYNENDNEGIVIICHSMGCLNSLYFLNSRTQMWKDKYIKSLITLSGVWGGSVKAMKAFASGDNFGVVVIPALSLRKDIRTFPSLAYLLPSEQVWPRETVLVKNRNRNYTVQDYKQFFDDIKYPVGYEMWKDVRNLTSPRVAPGVAVHCLHGHKVTTMDKLEYLSGEFPDTARLKLGHGDGDGTVNDISLEACSQWRHKQKNPVYHEKFPNIDHMAILSDHKVMDYIVESLIKDD